MKKETKLLLSQLEEKQAKQQRALTLTRHKIDDIKENELLPELKKKYEGKYWKYDNCYNASDRWWLYSYCKEVKNTYSYSFVSFETTPNGSEFKINDGGSHLCQIQITKAEYNRAAKSFLKQANKIVQQ